MDLMQLIRKSKLMPVFNRLDYFYSIIVRKICGIFGDSPLTTLYNNNFFNHKRQVEILKDTPQIVAETLEALFKLKSIIDFGCGTGIYLNEFKKKGVVVRGVDGSRAALNNSYLERNEFFLHDLTHPFDLNMKYDGAICFEVAEHVPHDKSGILVDNVIKASDLIFFTAAPHGQGGRDHINEQDPLFWKELFGGKGYIYLEKETEDVREIFKRKNIIFWITNNLMIFKKKTS